MQMLSFFFSGGLVPPLESPVGLLAEYEPPDGGTAGAPAPGRLPQDAAGGRRPGAEDGGDAVRHKGPAGDGAAPAAEKS